MDFGLNNVSSVKLQQQKLVEAQKTIQTNTQKFEVAQSKQNEQNVVMTKQLQGLYTHIQNTAKTLMNDMQQNIFMRDMLNLPKEWNKLLLEFSIIGENTQLADMLKSLTSMKQNVSQEALLLLLSSNSKLDIATLAAYLNKNSAIMTDKLLKYIGNNQLPQNSIAQLKNLLLIGASISNHQTNPNEFLKDILQMYLPWLPINSPKEGELTDIETQFSGSGTKEFQVSFYISTEHMGYFKIEILLGDENDIYITNLCKKNKKGLKEELYKILEKNIKTTSINSKIFYTQKTEEEGLKLNEKQLFLVNTTDSTVGLILIQLISKVIFDFDGTQAKRFELLDD